jgi:hypothetical protein
MIDVLTDLNVFFADWGEAHLWTCVKGAFNRTLTGVFDSAYSEFDLSSGGMSSTKPAMIVKTADIAEMSRGDTIAVTSVYYAVSGADYIVVDRQDNPPDLGPGLTRIILQGQT